MMKPIKITADTAAEASAKYRDIRNASGKGASQFPDGEWNGHHISYNGRVWKDGIAIYNPGWGKTPQYWIKSSHPDAVRK